eukprot:Gregarina_sp_Poly_1__10166@NODE_699_length_6701_cov_39_270274_g527_i0_p2_GENE_NODE_699_length_6701_cov_39_270274_g527_i0NODE_699_length_6701_cov_39_270274_g527_i0_p2_ORF_typecomplete_len620_score61_32Lipase_3/PF01764_25/2_3e14DUF2974/PF11187_8/0_013DUF676/PF05057_14/0_019DUF818/PF05677_12/0_021Chlorophyllase2/PF12740_7/0_087Chlorophyllase/PF07224_11/0_11Abhydrolase_1/PF00561_20/1_3e03Abhydrolase_1/PF00561_20/0_34Hydrolase_4/PF12146_8/0_19PAFAH_p_II/PF03403_13/0_2Abhydrolase_5/PF12695_7/0_36_NODE
MHSCLFVLLCIFAQCKLLPQIWTPLPSRLGLNRCQDFCRDGIPGALQRTVKLLFQNDLSMKDAQALRFMYFSERPAISFRNITYKDTYDNNTLLAVTKIIPVLKDILDMPDGKMSAQLVSFSSKVCKLMDAETKVSRLVHSGTPFSCVLIDAIQAGIACAPEKPPRSSECSLLPRYVAIPHFPDSIPCHLSTSTLQYISGAKREFMWNSPATVVTLPMINMLKTHNQELPDTIPSAVRDAELHTYLALYRAVQLIYSAEEHTPQHGCPSENIYRNLELVPGWRTVLTVSTIQPTRFAESTPSLDNMYSSGSRFPLAKFQEVWREFWDEGMQKAASIAFRDVKLMLNDPINTYKAFADILTQITFPAMIEKNAQRQAMPLWSQQQSDILQLVRELAFDARHRVNEPIEINWPKLRVTPTIMVSQNPHLPCEFAIGVKGTTTFYEWILDFNFWYSSDSIMGTTHRGVQDIVQSVWPSLRESLMALSSAYQCTCSKTRLLYYGHSLGGAVAAELAFKSSVLFGGRPSRSIVPSSEALPCDIRVDCVMFSPLKSMEEQNKENFTKTVNARSLTDLNDPLTHLPCHSENSYFGFPRCSVGHAGFAGVGRDVYSTHPGIVWVKSS